MKVRKPILAAALMTAVLIAVYAATPAVGGPSIGKIAKQMKKLKRQVASISQQQGPQGVRGIQGVQGPQGGPGAAGTAVAYARITVSGDVVEAESKGITDADVSKTGNAYCFEGLPFTPKNIQVMQHYSDTAGTIGRQTALLNADSADCTGATEQATVVFYVTSDIFTSATVSSGFYVLFQ